MSSSSWASKRQSRENWAEEVIAAAMKTGSEEGKKSLQVSYILDTGHFFHISPIQCLVFLRHTLRSRIQNLGLFRGP